MTARADDEQATTLLIASDAYLEGRSKELIDELLRSSGIDPDDVTCQLEWDQGKQQGVARLVLRDKARKRGE